MRATLRGRNWRLFFLSAFVLWRRMMRTFSDRSASFQRNPRGSQPRIVVLRPSTVRNLAGVLRGGGFDDLRLLFGRQNAGLLRFLIQQLDEQLSFLPERATRNRKPLEQPAPFGATWELRL